MIYPKDLNIGDRDGYGNKGEDLLNTEYIRKIER